YSPNTSPRIAASRPHCVICLKAELWLDGSIIIPRMGHRLKWNHHLLLHGQKSLSPCYFNHRSEKQAKWSWRTCNLAFLDMRGTYWNGWYLIFKVRKNSRGHAPLSSVSF